MHTTPPIWRMRLAALLLECEPVLAIQRLSWWIPTTWGVR